MIGRKVKAQTQEVKFSTFSAKSVKLIQRTNNEPPILFFSCSTLFTYGAARINRRGAKNARARTSNRGIVEERGQTKQIVIGY